MNGGGEGENEPTDAPVGRYGQYPQGGAGSWVNSRGKFIFAIEVATYRDRNKGMQILLSNIQAGPGRKVKQEQEEISRNHVWALYKQSTYDTI